MNSHTFIAIKNIFDFYQKKYKKLQKVNKLMQNIFSRIAATFKFTLIILINLNFL